MNNSGIGYLIKQGFRNLWHNKMMTFASVGVLCACLIITGAATLLGANVNAFVDYLGAQNEVVVFLADGLTDSAIEVVQQSIEAHSNVAEFTFISKEQALEEEMGYLGEYAGLLEGYTGENNPLPASFRVTLKDLANLTGSISFLESISGVYYVSSSAELVSILLTLKKVVNYASWAVVIALSVVSLVVIANTIRLTVFARRKEINIMKFVGATNGFIRLPFLVEGVAIGMLAALVALLVVLVAYWFIIKNFVPTIGGLFAGVAGVVLPLQTVALPLVAAFLLAGALVGGIGSGVSVRKHLQV
ncbi:permease-like cell division protein FtsX [Ruminococcaceae bacterium OttesenSCG-928-N02]|nr:permease-like cell division protein FtsX [Ruminococcaceae bacterium OttesenSCG-928-N02]